MTSRLLVYGGGRLWRHWVAIAVAVGFQIASAQILIEFPAAFGVSLGLGKKLLGRVRLALGKHLKPVF